MSEGSVRIKIKTIHSDKVLLDMPEAELEKLVTGTIDCVYRPYEEKAENTAWKEERKAQMKNEKKLIESETDEDGE